MDQAEAKERFASVEALPFIVTSSRSGLFRGSVRSVRAVASHGELLFLLVKREIRARYKDSYLGIVWSLFRPLAQLLIYYFAIGQILGAARQVPDFAIFVFIGLTMWGLFAEIMNSGTSSIVANAGLIKKVYLPREIFPLSAVGGALFNFAVQLVILIAALFIFSAVPGPESLGFAPLALLLLVVYATAFALILSAINVYLRDVQHLVEIGLIVGFWASPIVYSFTFVHQVLAGTLLEQIYLSNPVTLAVLGMQKALWAAGSRETDGVSAQVWPDDLGLRMTVAVAIGLVLLWLAQRVFARLQSNFAQEL
jgi:ABC-2 type transport system permease protein